MPEANAHSAQNASSNRDSSADGTRSLLRARWAERVFFAALCVYAVLAVMAHKYAYFEWDLALARRIQSIDVPGFRTLLIAISFLGNGWLPWLLVIVAGVSLIGKGYRAEGSICMSSVGLGWVVNMLLKVLIGRPRPTGALLSVAGTFNHESFPSGHVVFFVEFFGYLLLMAYVLQGRGWMRLVSMILLALPITLVGLSRVYLGAHWPSDVTGAYLAGGIWLMLSFEAYRQIRARRR